MTAAAIASAVAHPAASTGAAASNGGAINNVSVTVAAPSFQTEATGLSWFWAWLFGPLYFAAWGFWGRALILALIWPVGHLVAPFLAYGAWRSRAARAAQRY